MMKFLTVFLLALSLSAHALDVPASLNLGDSVLTEITGELMIENSGLGTENVDIGTLQSPYFALTTNCSCQLLRNRMCKAFIKLKPQPRTPSDYVLTDSLTVNGQVVTISATVKAFNLVEDSTKLKLAIDSFISTPAETAINYGNITAPTTLIYEITNYYVGRAQSLNFVVPSGMVVDPTSSCFSIPATGMLRNRSCEVKLTLSPVVCAGALYAEEFKVFSTDFKIVLPVTADFTGATSPLCVP